MPYIPENENSTIGSYDGDETQEFVEADSQEDISDGYTYDGEISTEMNIGEPPELTPEYIDDDDESLIPIGSIDHEQQYLVEYLTTKDVTNYDPYVLEELYNNGATFYAVYDDDAVVEVEWTDIEILDPIEELVTFDNEIANALNQHFWNDSSGVHVVELSHDDWDAAVTNNFSDLSASKNYYNILLNSLGVLLRRALYTLVSISRGGIAFYDGLGNETTNIMSYFGRDSAQIGRENGKHLVINNDGITVYNGDGTVAPLNAANINAVQATINELIAGSVTTETLRAASAYIAALNAANVSASDISADKATIGSLVSGSVTTETLRAASAYIAALEAASVSANDISANKATLNELVAGDVTTTTLRAASAYIAALSAASISANDISADHATIGSLSATYATIDNLDAATARIGSLETDNVSVKGRITAAEADVDNLQAATADIDTIRANSAKVANLTAAELEADHATIGALDTNYAQVNLANVDNAWIENGVVKDGAITNAMINSVSANKLTAGTIDASNITVTNLNADNITAGTINGERIGNGSLSLSKLEEDVYTETEVDGIVQNLQTQIDGAIETWTGTDVPTLQNTPAVNWKTNAQKDSHVGDVYFVVNSNSQQNGYNYRFTKSGSTYSWQLIKDTDITNALQRISTAEGKITTFDSDISQLKTDTGTLTTKTTSLETRMSDAEADILDKVDTTTFNSVSDTVDSHSQSITQMTTTLSNKADSSTVTAVTNRVSKNEQDISGINTTIGELQNALETKADGSTVSTISNKLNTVSNTVDGHTQSLQSIAQTQTTIQKNAVKSTVQLWFTKADTTAPAKPTAHVTTNNAATGNAWNLAVPSYNSAYPNYYYCYEYQYVDGSYGWSAVTRDIATGEMQSTARQARDDIDNLEIGGRNLFKSTTAVVKVGSGSATISAYDASYHGRTFTVTSGEAVLRIMNIITETNVPYTISFTCTASAACHILVDIMDNNPQHFDLPEGTSKFVCTSTPYRAIDSTYHFIDIRFNAAGTYKLADIMVEQATKASAWSPATEDVDADISTAQTSADNAQATANKNIKESQQLWFTKVNDSAPNKPTSKVTSTSTGANAWTTKVPTYNASSPYYFYCMQYVAADGTVTWSDVVYDRATTEAQSVARTTSANLTTLQQDYATFKQTTQNFESTIGSTYATKTELGEAVDNRVDVDGEFLYRATGGGQDVPSGRATVQSVRGNTLVWNQLLPVVSLLQFPDYNMTNKVVSEGVLSGTAKGNYASFYKGNISYQAGHRYLQMADVSYTSGALFAIRFFYSSNNVANSDYTGTGSYQRVSVMHTFQQDGSSSGERVVIQVSTNATGNVISIKNWQLFDLTTMFGAGKEPSTVAEFEALFPKPYYLYDAGSLLPVRMEGIETVGFNLLNLASPKFGGNYNIEVGRVLSNAPAMTVSGENPCTLTAGAAWNGVTYVAEVFKGQSYQFTTNINAATSSSTRFSHYTLDDNFAVVRKFGNYSANSDIDRTFVPQGGERYFAASYSLSAAGTMTLTDTCLHLSGPRNGEYEPYWKAERTIPAATYFPDGMRSAGSVYDELTEHEAICRVAQYTFTGTEGIRYNVSAAPSGTENLYIALCNVSTFVAATGMPAPKVFPPSSLDGHWKNIECDSDKLPVQNGAAYRTWTSQAIGLYPDNSAAFIFGVFGVSTSEEFNAWLATNHPTVCYEVNEPTTTPIDPPLNLTYKAEQGGTERIMVDATLAAPQSAPVPMLVQYGINIYDMAAEDALRTASIETRVTNAETSITQNKNDIALRAKASDVYTKTAVDGKITQEVSDRNSAIEQSASAINLSVSQTYTTKTEFNNLEIGGRNLLRNTNWTPETITAFKASTYSTTQLGNAIGEWYKETQVTLGFDASGLMTITVPNNSTRYGIYQDVSLSPGHYILSVDTGSFFKSHIDSVQWPSKNAIDGSNSRNSVEIDVAEEAVYRVYISFNNGAIMYGNYMKLEKGNRATDWTPAPEDYTEYTDSQVEAAKAAIKITTDGISSTVEKISSVKYLETGYQYALSGIRTYAAENYSGSWNTTDTKDAKIGDTVYLKVKDSTRNCYVYIKATVTAVSGNRVTCTSHGYEDVLPVDTIKSTINQSSDSVKIQAKHVEIDGTAIFTAISSDVDDAITDKGYATTTQAQGYANTAKSEAISASATDATSKANAAESNAKADTTSRLNAMGADNKVVNGAFVNGTDNWSAWGTPTTRNRVQVNGKWWMHCVTTATAFQGYQQNHYTSLGVTVEPSTTYTVGITARGAAANTKVCVGFHWQAPSGTSNVSQSWCAFTVGTAAARQYQTVTVPSGIDHFNVMVGQNVTTAQEFWITDVTLVKGTVNQEWSESSALAGQASNTANAATPKANAVKRTQRIWYRKSASGAPSTPGTASSNWVTKADDGNDAWTKMHIAISSTHKYIYTCEQYEMADGTVGYTSVLLDNTITVIDGGNIITGSVTANKLNAANINASKTLTVGAMTDAAASTILNSNVQIGGRNLLRGTGSPSTVSPINYEGWFVTSGGNGVGSIETIADSPVPAVTRAFRITGNTSGNRDFAQKNKTLESDFTGPYRFSAWVRGVGGSVNALIRSWNITTEKAAFSKTINGIGTDWTYIDFEFVPSGNSTKLGDLIDARFGITGAGSIEYVAPKLERGNKATDWTPAPEDVDVDISAAAKTATNYITADSTGIRIANTNPTTATTYQHQTATETEFVVEGKSMGSFSGTSVRIGSESDTHVEIEATESNGGHIVLSNPDDASNGISLKMTPTTANGGMFKSHVYSLEFGSDIPSRGKIYSSYYTSNSAGSELVDKNCYIGMAVGSDDYDGYSGFGLDVRRQGEDGETNSLSMVAHTYATEYQNYTEEVSKLNLTASAGTEYCDIMLNCLTRENGFKHVGQIAASANEYLIQDGPVFIEDDSLYIFDDDVPYVDARYTKSSNTYGRGIFMGNYVRPERGDVEQSNISRTDMIAGVFPYAMSNADVGVTLEGARVVNGTRYTNALRLGVNESGGYVVQLQRAPWLSALGLGETSPTNLSLNSATKAYSSSWTPKYRKWGNVVEVYGAVSPKAVVAAEGTLTIATLPTGYRPSSNVCILCQGSGAAQWFLTINPNGVMEAARYRSGSTYAAMQTNSFLVFNATFIVN